MLLISSNERDLPDLTPEQLDEDLEAIRQWAYKIDPKSGRAHAFQEANEAEDHAQIRAKFPASRWNHLGEYTGEGPRHENVLALTKNNFEVRGSGYLYMNPGRPKVSPHREATWAAVVKTDRPDLAKHPFIIAGRHDVSGAWTHPGQAGDADGWRKAAWTEGQERYTLQVKSWVASGFTVFTLGDFNRITGIPLFTPETFSLASNRYDHIFCSPAPGGVQVTSIGTEMILSAGLHTDHPTIARRVRLDPPK